MSFSPLALTAAVSFNYCMKDKSIERYYLQRYKYCTIFMIFDKSNKICK